MNNSSPRATENVAIHEAHAVRGFAGLGQHILNLLDAARMRSEARRTLSGLSIRELDDCGMTLSDVEPAMPDMFANDFRVQHVATQLAA